VALKWFLILDLQQLQLLYDVFVDKDSPLEGTTAGTVWDPSMGYGGRLLGAIAAGVNYIGTDPCIPTYEGLQGIFTTLVILIITMTYIDKVVKHLYQKTKV